jgi:hypothetical protein
VPLLGLSPPLVLWDLEDDAQPMDFSTSVARFLSKSRDELAIAAPHVFRNCQAFVSAVGEDEVPVRISAPEDVWLHVEPKRIRVSRRSHDNSVYIVIAAECAWEEEHGLQLVYRAGQQLSRVSDQDGHLTHASAYGLPESQNRIS